MLDKYGYDDDEQGADPSKPHESHKVIKVGQLEAIYCTRCAAYASRANLKKLSGECKGEVPLSSKRNMRLLQLGILPGKGVRIPPSLLRKRKKRW